MLPKQYRAQLRTNRSFFRQARRLKSSIGLFLWFPQDKETTVTVVAGKKVHGSAVQRHAVKRRWRSAAYELIKQQQLPTGVWAVYPNRTSLNLRGVELVAAMRHAVTAGVSTYDRVLRPTG